MSKVGNKVSEIIYNACELRSFIADEYGVDPDALPLDLKGYDDREIIDLKTNLDNSVGELTDILANQIKRVLKTKNTIDFPPCMDTLVGKVLTQNNITKDDNELKLGIGNAIDRMCRLPIDRESGNLHHYKSPNYRRTVELNPDLNTLVKGLVIGPTINAYFEEIAGEEDQDDSEDRAWRASLTEINEFETAEEEDSEEASSVQNEYISIIKSMSEIAVPCLFERLKETDNNRDNQIDTMQILAEIGLDYNAEQEMFLVNSILKNGKSFLQTFDNGCDEAKFAYELGTLAELKYLNYNPHLEKLLGNLLSGEDKSELGIHYDATKILSKMRYGNNTIQEETKIQLLQQITKGNNYNDMIFYAITALTNNIKSISTQDLDRLLTVLGQTDADELVTALVIKIAQSREDLRPRILDSAWSKIQSEVNNPGMEVFGCFEIVKSFSQDRVKLDEFIKSKALDQHNISAIALACGTYESLTKKHQFKSDLDIDALEPKVLIDQCNENSAFIPDLTIKWYQLADNYDKLVEALTHKQDEDRREFIADNLLPFMHNEQVIDQLKNVAINSEDEELQKIIIDLMGFAASTFSQCIENETTATEGNGIKTATKLNIGDPSQEIKTKALDTMLDIAVKVRSPEINEYVNNSILRLGTEVYEQVIQTSNESQSKTLKAQLAELIMLNSRYLRSISYPAAA